MNVVIYARFSSHNQTEQSIEGQLKICHEYAENNGHTVIGEYIDRAVSGTTDNRAEFQRMIADSDSKTFERIIVYQLDRFARSRYDSAIYRAKLLKNGVKVLSAKEHISDDASGILMQGVLESLNEYYSAELSQKIRRGMDINAEKCLSNGSNAGLGFKVDSEKRFYVDEEEAKIVEEIFKRYAIGESAASIVRDLNARNLKTSIGKDFNKNSLNRILTNKRYIGYYLYDGNETPDGMPRIISDDLFFRVQKRISNNKKAPAHSKNYQSFTLTTKLFCGKCNEPMTGYGGTSKTGKRYNYYMCNNAKKKLCDRKAIRSDLIETSIIKTCMSFLSNETIESIARNIISISEKEKDSFSVNRIKKSIKENKTAIENLWKAIEIGGDAEKIIERINLKESEQKELEIQLETERRKQGKYSYEDVIQFFKYLKNLPKDNTLKLSTIINVWVSSVYLYEDYYTLFLNAGKEPICIENIPLNDIEWTSDEEFIQRPIGGANTTKRELYFFRDGFAVKIYL